MEALAETLTPLDKLEVQRAMDIAQNREDALFRGRAVFLCTAKHAVFEDLNIPTDCARIEFHWDDEAVWQARAWNGTGELIHDTVSNGKWVEAGGKRWHINYLLGDSYDERRQADAETRDRWWDLEFELERHLWCRNLCANQLFLDHLVGQWGRTGPLYRDNETGDIVYRIPSREQHIRPRAMEWLRWLWTRMFHPETTLEDTTGRPMVVPESNTRIDFDGEFLHPRRGKVWIKAAGDIPAQGIEEHWLEPFRLDNGFFIARVHKATSGFSNPMPLHRSELVIDESDISENAKIQIRPVDMSLPVVER